MPIKLTRRHGSPYWYLRGSIRGVRVDESTGLVDRAAAEEVCIRRAAEIQERSIRGDSASRTFAEATVSYLEAGGDGEQLPPILRIIGNDKLERVDQARIEEVARRLHARSSAATVNRKVFTPIAAVLHHAARKKWCSKPVLARPKQPPGRIRWATHDEAERMIAAAAPHLRPLMIFLFSTGARLSEALYLDWRDVDLSRCHVAFTDTKSGEARGVPLHPRAVAALANLQGRKGAVFRRPDGKPYEERVGGGGQIKKAWAGMLKRAEISDFTPHDCRHTWATWHYAANRDLTALMQLGGWKSLVMVARYAHVNVSHLAPTIGRLWGVDGTPAEPVPVKSPR